ncbi:Imm10 family immunity protein [Glycomyces buryatensis]|uniref:Uncharacterized protein n=1 Tax=Glycomyces buryatensis TaxID=2570927 RepID=A0A4V4HQU6_9ACTN|nr:hypothetical protein FAB82_23590 [Glycomyces buryatensis]
MRLTQTEVGFFDDYDGEEVLEVGLQGTGESGSQRSFSIQRSTYQPDEQDVQNGMDSYCVSTERGLTLYGCLSSVCIGDSLLTLEFREEDARILGSEILVEFEIGKSDESRIERAELARKLREVLDWGAEDKRPELVGFDG